MAHPTIWPKKTFFYPVGNTTPSCFTQELAPEVDANVLLLACGDPRSILYTIHSQLATADRRLDFTCCDWEPAILARNIMLLTMIVDGVDPSTAWAIFYHFFLDKGAQDVLMSQCRILIQSSISMETWRTSKYGHFLRFCTDHSRADIRRHWVLYAETIDLPHKEKEALRASFSNGMKSVLSARTNSLPHAGLSAGPLAYTFLTDNLTQRITSYQELWSTGVTARGLGQIFNVHYGTNPLQAFFLAPGLTSIKDQPSPSRVTLSDFVKLSMDQFSAWSTSFRRRLSSRPKDTVIRFFVGETLAFCQALHYCRENKVTNTGFYTYPWGGSQIDLDREAYGSNTNAPMLFNIIDTSNLTDHAGLLNVLVVTIPLLQYSASSVIHTDTLLPSQESKVVSSGLPTKTCADIPTFSLLFGIAPTSHTSHFTTSSGKHQLLTSNSGQIHETISWKMTPTPVLVVANIAQILQPNTLSCDPKKLSRFLLSFYLQMFADENQKINSLDRSVTNLRRQELICYLRASFVAVLRLVRERVNSNWDQTIKYFLDLLLVDRTLLMGMHSYQELTCQLHLRGLYTLRPSPLDLTTPRDLLRNWTSVPPVACVVLKIPRRFLKIIENMDVDDIGTPPLQCEISGSTFHNIHACFQPIFGDIRVSHVSGEGQVEIIEDPTAFNGNSPLIVTFYIPTTWVFMRPAPEVGLHLRTTPNTVRLIAQLGMRLTIFSTSMTDTEHVQIVRDRPNNATEHNRLKNHPPIPGPQHEVLQTTGVAFDPTAKRATTLTIRDAITDVHEAKSLAGGAAVVTQSIADCSVLVEYEGYKRIFTFPYPVQGNQFKTRIARKSSYIEIECPIRPNFDNFLDFSLSPFPVARIGQAFNILNMHYLNLDALPALWLPTTSKNHDWLSIHLGMTLSQPEAELREKVNAEGKGVLLNLKDIISHILLTWVEGAGGAEKKRPEAFGLYNARPGIKTNTLIFINDIKLDLAGHTVIADACVVPLTDNLVTKIGPVLQRLLSTIPNRVFSRVPVFTLSH